MAKWKVKIDAVTPGTKTKYHPITLALLRDRGFVDEASIERFFRPDYDRDLHDPFLFASMRKVVDRMKSALAEGERIGIFGDYDADGVTSSVLLRTALERLGFPVTVYIPHKEIEGHGVHQNALDAFQKAGVTVMFTVDCGMTNIVEVAEANRLGMDVIIIDHHHVPAIFPDAFAIINPKVKDCGYPFQELCGAGTTFKVIQALYQELALGEVDQLKWLLDLAAVGTVADVMPLIGENRALVTYGLVVLSKTKNIGLLEMYAVGKLKIDEWNKPDARMIGFQIGPRINAASRMDHGRIAHDLLASTDQAEANILANRLEQLNNERRKLSERIAGLVRAEAHAQKDRQSVIAVHPEYTIGVVGLVAGTIAREIGKPVVVLRQYDEHSTGSLRSVPGLNIIEVVERCGDLLEKFGGHAQAAGLTVRNSNLPAFRERFDALVRESLPEQVTDPEQHIDICIDPSHLTMDFLSDILSFAPFGQGNPEPVFLLENLRIESVRFVGTGNKHLKIVFRPDEGSGKSIDAIAFSLGARFPDLKEDDRVSVVFQLSENTWNGVSSLQLKVLDMELVT
ncbi:MAG: single-stranded-DNA-specific exonuclease RecJ [Candidatus Moraniibacteriota bacterium]